MTRRTLFTLPAPAALFASKSEGLADPDFAKKLLKFQEHYNRFFRDYFGCPANAISTDECKGVQAGAVTHYEDYLPLCKLATELFPR